MTESSSRPIYGPKAFRLNVAEARRKGFRIFSAWLACGCCQIDMAFADLAAVRREFDPALARFADRVRDDMGNTFEAVNTGRGFREVLADQPVKKPRPIPILPIVVIGEPVFPPVAPTALEAL